MFSFSSFGQVLIEMRKARLLYQRTYPQSIQINMITGRKSVQTIAFWSFSLTRPGYLGSYNLWLSLNLNYQNPSRGKQAHWTQPVPLAFPLETLWESSSEKGKDETKDGSALGNDPPENEGVAQNSFSDSNRTIFSVNSDDFEGSPSLVYREAKALELFFTFAKTQIPLTGAPQDLDIYFTKQENGNWKKPQALTAINSKFEDRMPSLSHDGRYLVFSSDRPDGLGGHDLWFSERDLESGHWSEPRNAGPSINSIHNETTPNFAPEGTRLFFSSNRPGGLGHYDIYTSLKIDGKWQDPKNLGLPYNGPRDDEGFSISSDGLWAYFASDRQVQPGKEGFDLYRVPLPFWLYKSTDLSFTGQVIDGSSKEILGVEATLKIFSPHRQEKARVHTSFAFRKAQNAKEINNFNITLESGFLYRVEVSAPGFIPEEVLLDYRRDTLPKKVDRHVIVLQKLASSTQGPKPSLQAEPCIEAEASCLEAIKIYFASNLYTLRSTEERKMQTVRKIMQKNPKLKIRIEGHTDSTNTKSYNQSLSERRAQTVRQILLRAGIQTERLSIRGYAFLKPAITEKSLEDRTLNRRVEFVRLK